MKIEFDKFDFVACAGMHRHEGTAEIIYVVSGEGVMSVEGGEEILRPGDVHYCPEGSAHSFRNDREEPLEFFAVVPTLKG